MYTCNIPGIFIYKQIQIDIQAYKHTTLIPTHSHLAKNQLDRGFWQEMWQFFASNLESG